MSAGEAGPAESIVVATLRSAGCVFAEDEARLLMSVAGSPAELIAMVGRRASGVPLEHVIGWAEFRGLRILVDPGVFVPRRRTEFLVDQAAALARPDAVVVDMCCGSGAVGAAVAAAVGPVQLYAVDIDPAAVRCARRNLVASGGQVFQGDVFEPLPVVLRGRVDILVVNAPYVPTGEIGLMPAEARMYEPRVALDGGVDGLDVQRRVIEAAAGWLAPGGRLLIETSERQEPSTAALVTLAGLVAGSAHHADLDATVVIGTAGSSDSGVIGTAGSSAQRGHRHSGVIGPAIGEPGGNRRTAAPWARISTVVM